MEKRLKMSKNLVLSNLSKSWIIDLDGTILKHNGYKLDGEDSILPGALEFLRNLPEEDLVIFLTSRPASLAQSTENFLRNNRVRYNYIIYDAPYGERIVINDQKPSGLNCAHAINVERDQGLKEIKIEIDPGI